ncbi:MAG: formylglycine-generating enzyme family protein [Planctomycetes bacterium]|nr:formylglycine-generating enzyme family protein [Planctomycetota bacterium]
MHGRFEKPSYKRQRGPAMTIAQAAQASRLQLRRIRGTRERSAGETLTHFRRGRMAMPRHQELPEKEGKTYELPTEAEWEYACRAGGKDGDLYGFGNEPKELGDYAWFGENSGSKTHPVGTKKANRWGLFDMHGNVWEWCADSPRKYPTKEEVEKRKGAIEDQKDPEGSERRVLRGGSWNSGPRDCRSAHRSSYPRANRDSVIGFRVVLRPGVRAP